MGEDELGHRSCSQHIPIEFWSRRKLGNFKDTMKMVCPDLIMKNSRMHMKCRAALHQHLHQHQHQEPQGLAGQEQQDLYVGHNGGYMIPTHRKIGLEMKIHFEKLLSEYGKNELIPVYLENDTPDFYLNREVKSEETHSVSDAEQCFEKKSQQSGN